LTFSVAEVYRLLCQNLRPHIELLVNCVFVRFKFTTMQRGRITCDAWLLKNFFYYFKDIGRRPVSDFKRMRLPILPWVVWYVCILLVYNLVILLEVYLLSFLTCVHANFIFAFLFSQLNWIFLILNVCLYFVFDLGEYIQLLNVGTSFQLTTFFLSDRFIVQFLLA
jgi:hypothetical protein